MNSVLACLVLLQTPLESRRVVGGTVEERRVYSELGRGHASFDSGEFWIEKDAVVFLSKSPSSCSPQMLEFAKKLDPELWYNLLRLIDELLPVSQVDRDILMRRPIFMLVQAPAGSSCGWRILEKRESWSAAVDDWSSVPEMKSRRVISSCADAVDELKKLRISKTTINAVYQSLTRPRSLADCHVSTDGGP